MVLNLRAQARSGSLRLERSEGLTGIVTGLSGVDATVGSRTNKFSAQRIELGTIRATAFDRDIEKSPTSPIHVTTEHHIQIDQASLSDPPPFAARF